VQANGSAPVDLEGFRASMRAAGIEEIVEPTLEVYCQEAPVAFERLEDAVARGDVETARAAAHSLKSSSGNIRARQAASMFERLEHAAESEDMEAISASFGELGPEFDRVIRFLAEAGVGR